MKYENLDVNFRKDGCVKSYFLNYGTGQVNPKCISRGMRINQILPSFRTWRLDTPNPAVNDQAQSNATYAAGMSDLQSVVPHGPGQGWTTFHAAGVLIFHIIPFWKMMAVEVTVRDLPEITCIMYPQYVYIYIQHIYIYIHTNI